MLYKIAHLLRDNVNWLWNIIEFVNGALFYIRYGKILKNLKFTTVPNGYIIRDLRDVPPESLLKYFSHQPVEAYTYFRPHGFDEKSIKRLQKNKAFLGYVLLDKEKHKIAG